MAADRAADDDRTEGTEPEGTGAGRDDPAAPVPQAARTEHPTGERQAARNAEDEPPG